MLALADLAYFTAVGVAIYALPLFVTGPLGSDKAGAGVAFGAFAISALLLRPFVGRLADSAGRQPLLVGGALLAAAGLALHAAVDSLALVVALRVLLGVAEAAFFVASLAALVDIAPPARLGEAISYNSLGLYLGLAFGPPLGEALVTHASFDVAWFGAAGLAVLAALVVLLIGETAKHDAEHSTSGLIHRGAIPVSVVFFTSLLAVGGFLAFAALHAEEIGMASSSLPLFLYGLVVVVCRIAFAKLPDRVRPLRLATVALALTAAGLATIAAWPEPAGMVTGVVVLAVGVTFSTPALFSAIFATAKPSELGAASGTASAAIDLGLGGGPIVLGFVAESAGIPFAISVAAGFAAAGATWAFVLSRRVRALTYP